MRFRDPTSADESARDDVQADLPSQMTPRRDQNLMIQNNREKNAPDVNLTPSETRDLSAQPEENHHTLNRAEQHEDAQADRESETRRQEPSNGMPKNKNFRQRDTEPTSQKRTRASIKIASENIRGRSATMIAGSPKWKAIAEDMRREKIGVMALQETHLTQEHVDELNKFHKHLKIWNTCTEDNPSGSGGVALAFNKLLTNTETVQTYVLVPGRAILATWEWHRGDKMTVLAIYAPTDRAENKEFWRLVKKEVQQNRGKFPKPDVTLGDFNMVEDEIDRFPAKLNSIDDPESFRELKRYLKMKDGWRETFPGGKEWTWRNRARTSMSRIDRIYLTHEMTMSSREWAINISGINANDHSRVQVEIVNLDAPDIGLGRWAMSQELAEDRKLLRTANALAQRAWDDIQEVKRVGRSEHSNAQMIWKNLKTEIARAAKRRRRDIACARAAAEKEKMKARSEAVAAFEQATQTPDEEDARENLRKAEEELHELKKGSHDRIFQTRDARIYADAETMKKSWFQWTKENRPRDTLTALKKPNTEPAEYVHDSQTMAEVAGEYHDRIQSKDLDVDEGARRNAMADAIGHVRRPMSGEAKRDAAERISRANVLESLTSAKNGSAAGLDGIIYEFWKAMNRKFEQHKDSETKWADIVGIMTEVYVDIEENGVVEESNFADGWLCPIYKKGDRTGIENYRPITLLNTDYKIYTKALALKLARAAPSMIHESQAGFIRGRSITNLTKITSLILNYAEAVEEDGMIVALDQEKAYDRIRHDYLAATLRAFQVPERMIKAVESLYSCAYTTVMINGHLSRRYRVTRGVRQGDPLSCLLFDLAIEPLAEMLRASQLKGYNIDGLEEKLIATLYADDTTVYLSKWDSIVDLERILDTWCLASGAKFNTAKTEIIPMGSPEFRASLIQNRRMREDGDAVPEGIRIAREGEPTRILGTWPGNGVKTANAWSIVIDKTQRMLDKWEDHHPTLNGKAMLSRTLAGGYTQYLTAAQGMPRALETKLDKMIMDFVWSGAKRHPVNMRTLRNKADEGGLDLFCAEERNEAQYITWIGAFLAPDADRPIWAYIADRLFRLAIIKKDAAKIPTHMRLNPFYQNWKVNVRKLPFILQQMVRVARKYGVAFDAPFIPQQIREGTVVWTHPALLNDLRSTKPWTMRCLKWNHAVTTVEDLEEIAELDDPEHEASSECGCENCVDDRTEGCRHPYRCQEMASEILGTIADKWNPSCPLTERTTELWDAFEGQREDALERGESIVFDAGAIIPSSIEEMGRVFVHSLGLDPRPASDTMRREAGREGTLEHERTVVQVIVCAGMTMDGTENARGGFAVHFPDEQYANYEQACTGKDQTYIRALALGMIEAIRRVPTGVELHIVMTCKVMVQYLTIDLKKHENAGWMTVMEGRQELRALAAALRSRAGETAFFHVNKKNRKDWPDVKRAQEVATSYAAFGDAVEINTEQYAPFDWPGVSLRGIGQKAAHMAIRESKARANEGRRETNANIATVKAELSTHCLHVPTTAQIWRGLRHRDISRKARNFLWKVIHGAHKIGNYFRKMPSPWKEMAECGTCGTTETMEHILLDCPDSRQEVIWTLVRDIFERRGIKAGVSIGTIMGCASVSLPHDLGGRDLAKERMYRIIVSESAFLIWKIRCEKRIEHSEDPDWKPSDREVTERWLKVIQSREWQDKYLAASRKRFPKGSKQGFTAWATWRDLSKPGSESFLQILKELGVFVSRVGDKRPLGIQWQGG